MARALTMAIRATNKGGTGSAILALSVGPEHRPRIDSISAQNGIALSFLTLTNRVYSVEWNTNLLNTN